MTIMGVIQLFIVGVMMMAFAAGFGLAMVWIAQSIAYIHDEYVNGEATEEEEA